ncbi:hypothetical protein PHYPSEUDO_015541 [Phytophthora pseudosyringae]|uniref:Uncharacterized protein n=1 Tax=Phytophthora pseudosyringae TaxID=221518 RepID=A0A8T1VZE9_9STRA|nr:hypothetical protein PHYPSEUDO_015541 [Phytophthora pseudosyringae]
MERKDRKRKAQEITESPRFVVQKINELHSALVESDTVLRAEISALRDELGGLQKQLEDKTEECARYEVKAAFLHPDAVIDRVRTKLWHHGDLTILRRVIDPHARVLRNTDGRGDRCLYLSDTPSKKSGLKAATNGARPVEHSPKRESEEAATPTPAKSVVDASTNNADMNAEEKQEEGAFDHVPPASEVDDQDKPSPQKEATTTDAVGENRTMTLPALASVGLLPWGGC